MELPLGIEAPQILHRVTKAQDFNVLYILKSEVSESVIVYEKWLYIVLFYHCSLDLENFGRRYSSQRLPLQCCVTHFGGSSSTSLR